MHATRFYISHKNNFEWKKSETKEHNIYDSIYIKVEKQAKVNCVRCQDNVYFWRAMN